MIGAFDGYFASAERLMAMRMVDITHARLAADRARDSLDKAQQERAAASRQQETDRAEHARARTAIEAELALLERRHTELSAAIKAENDSHEATLKAIKAACEKVNYVCMGPKMDAQSATHNANLRALTDDLRAVESARRAAEGKLHDVLDRGVGHLDSADAAVKEKMAAADKAHDQFVALAMDSQIYRWASEWYGISQANVTAEQANRILGFFAAAVAVAYIMAQTILALSYYGAGRPGFSVKLWHAVGIPLRDAMVRGMRLYWARRRRVVYRNVEVPVEKIVEKSVDKIVEKLVPHPVPETERVEIVFVPVPDGGPLPEPKTVITRHPTFKVAGSNP
jgi:hypothetical protein